MRTRGRPRHPDILTPREWEVFSLIEQGASNDEIAQRLGVTERTAKYHVSEILSKLGVSSREQAVMAVAERSARPVGLAGLFGHWALAAKAAATLAAGGVLVGVAVLAWGVVRDEGDETAISADMTVEEISERVLAAATRPNQVLHSTHVMTAQGPLDNNTSAGGEYWTDPHAYAMRSESDNGQTSIRLASGTYTMVTDGAAFEDETKLQSWCPDGNLVLESLLSCKTHEYARQIGAPVIKDAEWDGQQVVEISVTYDGTPLELEDDFGPSKMTLNTYLDPETALPVACKSLVESDNEDLESRTVSTYERKFVDRASLPADFFDPASIGWSGD
jgi:DNA-binding CsgD family transcriptional regulator